MKHNCKYRCKLFLKNIITEKYTLKTIDLNKYIYIYKTLELIAFHLTNTGWKWWFHQRFPHFPPRISSHRSYPSIHANKQATCILLIRSLAEVLNRVSGEVVVCQNDASLFPRQIRGANDAWRNSINCLGFIRIFADSCLPRTSVGKSRSATAARWWMNRRKRNYSLTWSRLSGYAV